MRVEVDPETFDVDVIDYVVVHDCGRVINPMILDGQIQGGVAQGIGNAFYEQLVVDVNGQLLNASLMDYLLPTATDVPKVRIDHIETLATDTPLGVKGAGEAGCIPTAAAFAQAVEGRLGNRRAGNSRDPAQPQSIVRAGCVTPAVASHDPGNGEPRRIAMKPAPFRYHAPETLDEALDILAEDPWEAKILAGGQSLIPAMNFRLGTTGRSWWI